ncbi:hypothetical protein Taro_048641, partial [Colocasia esculenta]|nr:hypothetical protein [Colocasia esculenta]
FPTFSCSSLDQQVYWNNVPSPGDAWNAPDHLLPRIEPNMSYRNVFNHETESLSGWNMGAPSSSEHTMNQDNHDASEMENVWPPSSPANSRAGPRFDERRLQAANILSLDSMAMDHSSNQILQGQFYPRNSTSTSSANNVDCNAGMMGNGGQVPQTGICPFYSPFPSEVEHPCAIGSSNSQECSISNGTGHFSEDADGRSGSLLDGRRLSGKRKNIEGVPDPSSGSPSNICFQQTENGLQHTISSRNVSSSSSNMYLDNLSGVHHPEECLNPRSTNGARGAVPECHSLINVAGSAESSQRNFRLRTIPSQRADPSGPNLWSLGNSSMNNSVWSPHHLPSLLIPVNQPLEARPAIPGPSSHSQSHLLMIPGLPQMVHPSLWNGASRIGTPLNCHVMLSERLASLGEEANLMGLQRNTIPELPMFVPPAEVRHVVEDHANWSLSHGNLSIPANVASTSLVGSTSGIHPSICPTWPPHQNPHNQYRQTSTEFVYRAFPAAVSDPDGQLNNFLAQHPGRSGSSDISPLPVAGPRTHQQPFLRSGFLMGRRSNGMGTPLASRTLTAAREGRNMIICEHIRNALDRMRRSVGMRLEEGYLDGEDLGTLDCGHNFHVACVKQWLTHKNICPICKMTALAA